MRWPWEELLLSHFGAQEGRTIPIILWPIFFSGLKRKDHGLAQIPPSNAGFSFIRIDLCKTVARIRCDHAEKQLDD
jgi:hypothetical protein